MKHNLRTQKENMHQRCKNCCKTIRRSFLPQSQFLCFKLDVEMKEVLLVITLNGQVKTPALVCTGDKYSKCEPAAMVVRGLNTNLKILGNH